MTQNKPSGYLETLNAQQRTALAELKEELRQTEYAADADAHPDGDRFLLRFMRASMKHKHSKRVFVVRDAMTRLLDTLQWRREQGLNCPWSEVQMPEAYGLYRQLSPQYFWADDKQDTFVYVERFGLLGNYLQRHHLTDDEWIACLAYNNERTAHLLRTQYPDESQGIYVIIDLRGFGWGFTSRVSLLKTINGVVSRHYPESLHKLTVVNAPRIFSTLFKGIKTFMDPDTVSKIGVHYGLPRQLMRDSFDCEFLPEEWGGDRDFLMPIPIDAPPKYHHVHRRASRDNATHGHAHTQDDDGEHQAEEEEAEGDTLPSPDEISRRASALSRASRTSAPEAAAAAMLQDAASQASSDDSHASKLHALEAWLREQVTALWERAVAAVESRRAAPAAAAPAATSTAQPPAQTAA